MRKNPTVIEKAEFNPALKKYILIYGILIMTVTIIGIPFILFWVIIAPHFINKYFERLECELTTRALRFTKGYLVTVERTIPLDKIQDLTFKEGPILKAFGLSILKVETAGSSNETGSDLSLIGIVDASAFRHKVLEQRDIVTENKSSSGTAEGESQKMEVLTEISASLKRIEQLLAGKKNS